MFIYGRVGQLSHRAVYLTYMQKYGSTKAGHENPRKTGRWKKHWERVPPTKAVVQPLEF